MSSKLVAIHIFKPVLDEETLLQWITTLKNVNESGGILVFSRQDLNFQYFKKMNWIEVLTSIFLKGTGNVFGFKYMGTIGMGIHPEIYSDDVKERFDFDKLVWL